MKTTKTLLTASLLALGLSACNVATTLNDHLNNKTDPLGPSLSTIPDEVRALVDSECNGRPKPMKVEGTFNGVSLNYTEVLAEAEEGNKISDGSSLFAKNLVGILHVVPSTDGKVYWGARKWTLAEDKTKADEAMKNIKITSTTSSGKANVVVDHPSGPLPAPRYQVCLVIKAPADWNHQLANVSGILTSLDHAGPLTADVDSGDVTIVQKGSGDVMATTKSGTLDIETDEKGGMLRGQSGSGTVTIDQRGPGFVTATTESGSIEVKSDSRGGVDLFSDSGTISSNLFNGGVALQNDSSLEVGSGTIDLILHDGYGLQLDAEVQTGILSVPDSFPAPQHLDNGSQKLMRDVNGGGKILKVRSGSGTIAVTTAQ